jgi:hypothetical protein
MAQDYQFTAVVSLTKVHEIITAKHGRRTYLMINNASGAAIKFDFGVAPGEYNGETLPAGGRYERDSGVPQSKVFIRGTVSGDQIVNTGQGFE